MSDAEKCRRNGWAAGTLLEGREEYDRGRWMDSRIPITAVGERSVLAREVGRRSSDLPEWRPIAACESLWSLDCRAWTTRSESP